MRAMGVRALVAMIEIWMSDLWCVCLSLRCVMCTVISHRTWDLGLCGGASDGSRAVRVLGGER